MSDKLNDEQRVAFEKSVLEFFHQKNGWHIGLGLNEIATEWRGDEGDYIDRPVVRGMWVGWQAALAHKSEGVVPVGWKLVPIEPTKEMWAAANKIDDEMAAGGFDGKGCTIEQAWNAMLVAAPAAPVDKAAYKCAARASVGAHDLQECDWPVCGCDPHADKVIAALQESGKLIEPIGEAGEWVVTSPDGRIWTAKMLSRAALRARFETGDPKEILANILAATHEQLPDVEDGQCAHCGQFAAQPQAAPSGLSLLCDGIRTLFAAQPLTSDPAIKGPAGKDLLAVPMDAEPVEVMRHPSRLHELKTDPETFEGVWTGDKTHEIRRNDRDFKIGDTLRLRETRYTGQEMLGPESHPLEYTGREATRIVSHIQEGYGLVPGWVLLSFALIAAPPQSKGLMDVMSLLAEVAGLKRHNSNACRPHLVPKSFTVTIPAKLLEKIDAALQAKDGA